MTTSEKAKDLGFKSLTQVAHMFKCTTQHLRNLDKNNPDALQIIFDGCAAKVRRDLNV